MLLINLKPGAILFQMSGVCVCMSVCGGVCVCLCVVMVVTGSDKEFSFWHLDCDLLGAGLCFSVFWFPWTWS